MSKYQKKHIVCSYRYKLVCVDDKFSKPFKTCFGKNTVYSKHCSDMVKKHFNKERVTTKKDNANFKNSSKCWICDKRSLSYHYKI